MPNQVPSRVQKQLSVYTQCMCASCTKTTGERGRIGRNHQRHVIKAITVKEVHKLATHKRYLNDTLPHAHTTYLTATQKSALVVN